MGNLGDALKKAGLINEKDVQGQDQDQGRRGQRRRGGGGGGGGGGGDRRPRPDRPAPRRDRVFGRPVAGESVTAEQSVEARALAREHAIRRGLGGRRRWHYIEADGRLPFVDVDEELGRRLEAGSAAIVSDGEGARIVSGEVVRRIAALDQSAVLFWVSDELPE